MADFKFQFCLAFACSPFSPLCSGLLCERHLDLSEIICKCYQVFYYILNIIVLVSFLGMFFACFINLVLLPANIHFRFPSANQLILSFIKTGSNVLLLLSSNKKHLIQQKWSLQFMMKLFIRLLSYSRLKSKVFNPQCRRSCI